MRIILLFLAVITIFWLVKRLFLSPPQGSTSQAKQGETLVECAQCKVHLPKSDAIQVNGVFYCCKEHAKQK